MAIDCDLADLNRHCTGCPWGREGCLQASQGSSLHQSPETSSERKRFRNIFTKNNCVLYLH